MSTLREKIEVIRNSAPPPIKATPGDLRMMLRTAVAYLDAIEKKNPNDQNAIDAAAVGVFVGLEHWIGLRESSQSERH